MVLYPESDEGHATEETWGADRPPQLNGTVCSCQSGSGCNHELEGDEGRDVHGDGASITSLDTLVASNNSEADESSPQSPDGPEHRVESEAFETQMVSLWGTASFEEIRARFGGSFNRMDRNRRTQRALGLGGDDDDMPDSMMNEPLESGDHSVVVSDKESVRCVSPGPGVGAWTDGLKMGMGIRKYYFIVSPLRLTPQRRNCRSLLASHLVAGDGASSSDVSSYFFRE